MGLINNLFIQTYDSGLKRLLRGVFASKVELSSKQDAINDLATIRSGAAAGATAVQPSVMNTALVNTVAESGVYDVTANNSGATFASLAALLSAQNLDTLIPVAKRKGGMSIKFVHTSDNKYVRYNLKTTSFSTDPDDWECVNDRLTNIEDSLGGLEGGVALTKIEHSDFTVSGKYINLSGTLSNHPSWAASQFVFLIGGTSIKAKLDSNPSVSISFYTQASESSFISSVMISTNEEMSIKVPATANYFRASIDTRKTGQYVKFYIEGKESVYIHDLQHDMNEVQEDIIELQNTIVSVELPEFHIAKKIYCVTNDTNLLFIRGLIHAVNPYLWSRKFISDISASNVRLFPRYLSINYTSAVTKSIKMQLISNGYDESPIQESQIIVKAPQSPANNINVVCLGSSTTNNGVWAGELKRRLVDTGGTPAGNQLSNISFVGRMHGLDDMNVQVEATGGWAWKTFIEGTNVLKFTVTGITNVENGDRYSYVNSSGQTVSVTIQEHNLSSGSGYILCSQNMGLPQSQSGTLTKVSGNGDTTISFTACEVVNWSPFLNNGVFGFTEYANKYCNGVIDVMICNLGYLNMNRGGVNDMTETMEYLKTFVDTLHTDFPNCKILITTTIGVSPNGGCGWDYGTQTNSQDAEGVYTDYGLLYGEFKFQDALEAFVADNAYKNFCYMVNSLEEVDMENAFPTRETRLNMRTSETDITQSNALHPTTEGSYMTADSIYRCFVCTVLN